MFIDLRIVDLNDPEHMERVGHLRASDIVAVVANDVDLNAAIRKEQKNIPQAIVRVTIVTIKTGGMKFATKELTGDFMNRLRSIPGL